MDFQKTTVKNSFLNEAYAVFKGLPPLKKSTKATYALARTIRRMRDPVESYDEARRNLFLQSFGEDTSEASPKHPKWPEFQKELRKLENMEIEAEYMKLDQADLSEEAVNELSSNQLEMILWLIEPQEAKKQPSATTA